MRFANIHDLHINPALVAIIHPDRGGFYNGVRTREPTPGVSVIITSHGGKFMVDVPHEKLADELEQASDIGEQTSESPQPLDIVATACATATSRWFPIAASATAFSSEIAALDNTGALSVEAEDKPDEAAQLLEWLGKRTDLDLSYQYDLEAHQIPHYLLKPGPIPEQGWCVHQRSGGHNDREWTMVSLEATPLAALREAHKAFCDGR